jgi:hypothetical protein
MTHKWLHMKIHHTYSVWLTYLVIPIRVEKFLKVWDYRSRRVLRFCVWLAVCSWEPGNFLFNSWLYAFFSMKFKHDINGVLIKFSKWRIDVLPFSCTVLSNQNLYVKLTLLSLNSLMFVIKDVKPVQCNNKKLYALKKTGVNQIIIMIWDIHVHLKIWIFINGAYVTLIFPAKSTVISRLIIIRKTSCNHL